jgi:hypothetical protein
MTLKKRIRRTSSNKDKHKNTTKPCLVNTGTLPLFLTSTSKWRYQAHRTGWVPRHQHLRSLILWAQRRSIAVILQQQRLVVRIDARPSYAGGKRWARHRRPALLAHWHTSWYLKAEERCSRSSAFKRSISTHIS